MKNILDFCSTSLKSFISLSVLLCLFGAYSHPWYNYDNDVLEVIDLISYEVSGSSSQNHINRAYVFTEEGWLWGVNYYLHFHEKIDEWTVKISSDLYNKIKKARDNIDYDICTEIARDTGVWLCSKKGFFSTPR